MLIIVYVLRNKEILKGTIVKDSKRGTSQWIQLENGRRVLVSKNKIYDNYEVAKKELGKRKNKNSYIYNKIKLENKKIDLILEKIYSEFGVSVPLLSRPLSEQDAKKLYNIIENDKTSRNKKVYI